jgi:hypothetical protein
VYHPTISAARLDASQGSDHISSMRCQVCNRETIPLFYSHVCEWCEGPGHTSWRGWTIAYNLEPGSVVYVFPSKPDAREWASVYKLLLDKPVVNVWLSAKPKWRSCIGATTMFDRATEYFSYQNDHRHHPVKDSAGVVLPSCWPIQA